jgi:hypothetical protein
MSEIAGVRSWLAWIIASIWIVTSVGVLTAYHIHPASEARATLKISEISFSTDASRLFDTTHDREVVASGLTSVQIRGAGIRVTWRNAAEETLDNVNLRGDRSSTCVFYNVRGGGLFLSSPSRIALIWNRTNPTLPLGVESASPASMVLTSQPGKSGLTCAGVHSGENQETATLNAVFSEGGGDSISVLTSDDSRLDLGPYPDSQIQATQIPILSTIRFVHVNPRGNKEESVLLSGSSPSDVNQIAFPPISKSITLDADLFVITPGRGFYIKSISVTDGIHLTMEGPLLDAQKGPGGSTLSSVMPTMLDRLLNEKGAFAMVPSLVALILGILEKMGVIPK